MQCCSILSEFSLRSNAMNENYLTVFHYFIKYSDKILNYHLKKIYRENINIFFCILLLHYIYKFI